MQPKTRHLALGAVIGVLAFILIALVVVIWVAYSGAYNVSATQGHLPFVRWTLETTMKNSISDRAESVQAPSLSESMVTAGATPYKSMCAHCHGGPGEEQSEWASGMLPEPPHLPDVISEWKPSEVFWLAKHGMRMSGMPAFGPTHSDDEIWNITAFVMQLPGMTEETYASFDTESSGEHGH
ncbi:c-type cytochrome [Halomonas korlensis]|uniref:Cytochrome C oxidase, cbb3-type, subunit III n=1 Tax=Halomonas korlensis TaxID=463301 RepID=A0A1I7GKZ1_9GAMM|nr:cytochrome c [Halomonas korlensis]SFU49095.1 Cytochrome C oxidase, cbb3-type, subunit III [Halomonas korlensis]